MRIIRALIAAIAGDPVRNAFEDVQDAMKDLARRQADRDYHNRMVLFYTKRAGDLKPETHWNEYAEARNKQAHYADDWKVEDNRVAEAQAKLDAKTDRYQAILDNATARAQPA